MRSCSFVQARAAIAMPPEAAAVGSRPHQVVVVRAADAPRGPVPFTCSARTVTWPRAGHWPARTACSVTCARCSVPRGNDGPMARYPPQTRYAQSSGAKIAYQVSGTGPPDLVTVPGLVSHLDIQWQQTGYRRLVRALERGGRLIRLDKRGTGLSDPAAELPTTQERVQDVAAVMAAAKSPRAVLFGLSDGGRPPSPSPPPIPAGPRALSSTAPRTGVRGPRCCDAPGRWCATGGRGRSSTWWRPAWRDRRRAGMLGRSSGRRPAPPWRRP